MDKNRKTAEAEKKKVQVFSCASPRHPGLIVELLFWPVAFSKTFTFARALPDKVRRSDTSVGVQLRGSRAFFFPLQSNCGVFTVADLSAASFPSSLGARWGRSVVTSPRTLRQSARNTPHADRNTDAAVFPFFLLVSAWRGFKKPPTHTIQGKKEAIKSECDDWVSGKPQQRVNGANDRQDASWHLVLR